MPGESLDVFTPLNINNPNTCSVVPGTNSPFQWANLPTYINPKLFPLYTEDHNLLPAIQPVSPDNCSTEVDLRDLTNFSTSHFTEMAKMSVYSPICSSSAITASLLRWTSACPGT